MLADHKSSGDSQLGDADQHEADRRALEVARSEWQRERECREVELAQRERELSLRECQVPRREGSLDLKLSATPNPNDGTPEPAKTSSSSDYDPVAALEKLRQMVETSEDELIDDGPQPSIPSNPQTRSLASDLPSESQGADDESIEAYMSRLMNRVNGQSEQTVTEPTTLAMPAAALAQLSADLTMKNGPTAQLGEDTDAPESAEVVSPAPQKP